MKKNIFIIFIAISAHGAFEDTGTGARATALGGAYAALGMDNYSIMYNPAGLAPIQNPEIGTEYTQLFRGLSDGSSISQVYLGYAHPLRNDQALGVGIKQFSLENLYKERTISIGYGIRVLSQWSMGVAVKQLYQSVQVSNTSVDDNGNVTNGLGSFFVRNGTSHSAYSFDLGMRYQPTTRQILGLSIQDINEPDIALSSSDKDIVPRRIRVAYAYLHPRDWVLTGSLMVHEGLPNEQDSTWVGGGEKAWWLKNYGWLVARGSMGVGSRRFFQPAFGVGYIWAGLSIDYAYVMNISGPDLGTNSGTHRFSLTYKFGVKPGDNVILMEKVDQKPAASYPQNPWDVDTDSIENLLKN